MIMIIIIIAVRPGSEFWELVNNMKTKPSIFFGHYQNRQKSTVWPFAKNVCDLTDLTIYFFVLRKS